MFEYSKEESRYVAMHHPFTAPRDEDVDKLVSDPGHVCAKAYDMVCNGYELGGGSDPYQRPGDRSRRCSRRWASRRSRRRRASASCWTRSEFGAPPHGGMAWGLERIVMVLLRRRQHPRRAGVPEGSFLRGAHERLRRAAWTPKQLEELGIAVAVKQEE